MKTSFCGESKNVLFSIIIPCYNNSETMLRAINSVLLQNFRNFEIIVIDDGSQDLARTEEIVNNINDSRVRFLKHTINKNGSTARNTGIKVAQGEYIALLDAD